MAEATGWLAALQAVQAANAAGSAAGAANIINTVNAVGNAPAGNFGQLTTSQLAQFASVGATPRDDFRQLTTPQSRPISAASGLPVSVPQLINAATLNDPGSSPAATGFPLLDRMIDNLLRARADKRAETQQAIDMARLFADLDRVSPTRAASLASMLGVQGGGKDLAFTNLFGTGAGFPPAGGGRVSGDAGGTPISLPTTFSGRELSFLGANPNVMRVVQDVADKLGVPDIFSRSAATRIPTMSNILSGAFG